MDSREWIPKHEHGQQNSFGADGPGRLRRGLRHIGRGSRPLVDHHTTPGLRPSVNGLLRDRFYTDDAFKEYGITVADDMTLINTELNKFDRLSPLRWFSAAPCCRGSFRSVGRSDGNSVAPFIGARSLDTHRHPV
jgi:hypothetical protein